MMAYEIVINLIMPYPMLLTVTYDETIYIVDEIAQKRVDSILINLMFF